MTRRKVKNQLSLFPTGKELRDAGIKQAIDHADDALGYWSERAGNFLIEFILGYEKEFMTEFLRIKAEGIVPDPPDGRAWGGVMENARARKIIDWIRYDKCKRPELHRTPKSVWIRNEKFIKNELERRKRNAKT